MKAKQKILIALTSFAVLAIMLFVLVVWPVFQGVRADRQQVLTRKQDILQMRENKKNSREFEMISTQYAKEFSKLENLFVDSKTPVGFFRFLDETAASFRLSIEKAPGSIQHREGDRWPSFEIRLTGEGLYPDFMAFLQKIENAPYLLEVKTLTLAKKRVSEDQENSSAGGEIEFSLSIKVFTK